MPSLLDPLSSVRMFGSPLPINESCNHIKPQRGVRVDASRSCSIIYEMDYLSLAFFIDVFRIIIHTDPIARST